MRRGRFALVFLLLGSLCFAGPAGTAAYGSRDAASALAIPGPDLASRSAVLMDAATGTVLYEKDPDEIIPPASLTKLMTMHLVLEAVAAGQASLADIVALPRETWAINQQWGSSLMFLAPGQVVTLGEIMLGLAVASGNDAAAAAAIHVSGSIGAFVDRMNAEAAKLGLDRTRFVDPSGYSELNLTTARDYTVFCGIYLDRHPEALTEFHSVKDFAYPQPRNLPEVFRDRPGTVTQTNRNLLLGDIEGVDGLKTGYIIESGYNIALTAKRGETRLVAVLLGGPGSSSAQGGRIRAQDGGKLLDWGFDHFRTIRPVVERFAPVRVWKGNRRDVAIAPAAPLEFTAGNERADTISWKVQLRSAVTAPIDAGEILGELIFSDRFGELRRVPLAAVQPVPPGNPIIRLFDGIALFFLKLFGATA